MKNYTNEFSFRLKPAVHGIGVFVLHDIAQGTKLVVQPDGYAPRILSKDKIPPELLSYCEARPEDDGTYFCPQNFAAIELSWFINHSNTPNVRLEFVDGSVTHYAARALQADEELFIDYNEFNEPEETKESFYR